ncbi:hypothetical protein GpartN1_g53.t1 [Galdieria partita]|uniref:Acid phosphatase n=1 Tax=Galdieria partita TaxID=83374 RepID=A0A9C7PR69_9RHOD|nr:hypothetical protein GpartN1_g53.t1 [Galdieria partita]
MACFNKYLTCVYILLQLSVVLVVSSSNVTTNSSSLPFFDHVIIIMMENTGRANITEHSSEMPFINELIKTKMYASHYHGYTNPSLPNYIAITAGSNYWSFSDDPNQTFPHTNIADLLENKGMTWKNYAQHIPSVGFLGNFYPNNSSDALYVKKHTPFALYPQITENATRVRNIVPYSQLSTDLATGSLPNYSFITPDVCQDMHGQSGSLCPYSNLTLLWTQGDKFVRDCVTNITSSKIWQSTNSVIFLTWDQSDYDNNKSTDGWEYVTAGPDSPVLKPGTKLLPAGGVYGGGPVPLIVMWSEQPNRTMVSNITSNHLNTLKTILEAWDLPLIGYTSDHQQVQSFKEFFQ